MNLLVTGGYGFIGSNFIRYILNNHAHIRVINLDKITYAGNLENLKEFEANPNYTFIKDDICEVEHVRWIFSTGIDAVVNFAAESHVDRSIRDPNIFVKTNLEGTQVLLEAARSNWNSSTDTEIGVKFIQVSTDEVYGSLGSTGFFTEASPLAPSSPYSASKAGADLMARAYYQTYRFPVAITRCSNNYGPYQFPEKLIPLMIINALSDKPLPVYGDGLSIRDWLHVADHCQAIYEVLTKGKAGETYNIGGNCEKTNLEVIKGILDLLNKPESLITFVNDRQGHDRRYAIDASKISSQLGWKPQHSFEQGLRDTVAWYINNWQWWQPLLT
ncbi:dTDP-glucose 4,6-dehydratase [Desulforamulus aquiferis]|uniref:dTDP-glucose 4,6-dehydratase n=1 Tax=Desulforamulus aquiferis TaxID=1397668 RepID=A0AAW7ZGG4_9FIRM|nr:dTDP-glucose 4,6-dehydratase [Desulforamulus aquiferis]MDO7788555.1 dTDP-glucose 4,6-dehydratase [Desulforamulus aquiferis]RYD03780.1 hypothetical protein N752_18710 [Desulforamulus aquiferis]